MNTNNALTDYISQNQEFLKIDNPDIEKICLALDLLGVKFGKINYDCANKALFQMVYRKNLYAFNEANITLTLQVIYGISEESIWNNNYSLIRSKQNEPLLKYIHENVNEYLNIVLSRCKKQITDDEKAVIALLNNAGIDDEKKIAYIEALQTSLNKIEMVTDKELWTTIFECSRCIPSSDNVLAYFFQSGNKINSVLARFINNAAETPVFDFVKIKKEFKEKGEALFSEVIQCEEINDAKYEEMLANTKLIYNTFSFAGIPSNKFKILVRCGIISMTKENLVFARKNYQNELVEFIITNQEKYTEIVEQTQFNRDEFLKLLLCPSFEDGNIGRLLQKNTESISTLIEKQFKLPQQRLKFFLSDSQISHEQKMHLIINQLHNLEADQAKECFEILNSDDYVALFSKKRKCQLPKSSWSEQILKIFQGKGWISGYETDKDNPQLFQVSKQSLKTNI
jgi:hypothetical protein